MTNIKKSEEELDNELNNLELSFKEIKENVNSKSTLSLQYITKAYLILIEVDKLLEDHLEEKQILDPKLKFIVPKEAKIQDLQEDYLKFVKEALSNIRDSRLKLSEAYGFNEYVIKTLVTRQRNLKQLGILDKITDNDIEENENKKIRENPQDQDIIYTEEIKKSKWGFLFKEKEEEVDKK